MAKPRAVVHKLKHISAELAWEYPTWRAIRHIDSACVMLLRQARRIDTLIEQNRRQRNEINELRARLKGTRK